MDALNPHSPIPLYRQLADILTYKIRTGEFPEGSRIPSEHQLAQNYGIGRPTARQATDQLVLNGTLLRRRGAGTFVRSAQKEVDLFSFAGTISSFQKKGIDVETRILQKIRPKRIQKDAENPFAGKQAYFSYRRVRDLEFEIRKRQETEEALRNSEQKYMELSIKDELTQLYNSRHFKDSLTTEVERSLRYNHPLSILLLDIDNFKHYNDRYGHLAGNKVLVVLGQVIQESIRCTDLAFRYGGEEFTVILTETEVEGAQVVAERIRERFEAQAFSPKPDEIIHNSVSIGLTQYKLKEDVKSLVQRADMAMYAAKRKGKNRVVLSYHDHSE